ncbi:kinase-like domain-containing protein [Hysterangium stoloniferum]|nr:kinase-like domain-containing protein [Hysterangium stoloniferum]
MPSLDTNKLPFCIPQSEAPSTYNPFRAGYKQEDIDMQPLNEGVYNLLGREVVRAILLGRGSFNVVYELEMRTGPPLVARIQWNFKADAISSCWAVEKISREVAVLKLLHRVSPQIPAPRVLACDFDFKNTVGAPFMIMSRLYGEDQWMAWPKLSGDDRVTFVKSLATSFVGIFNVRLPSIGSVETLTPGGLPIIGSILPYMTLLPIECATLEQYITRQLDHAFAQPHDQALYDFSLPDLFDRIRTLAISAIPRDDHTMLVPVLVHMDLRSKNIMVKDATVSGIVDWEIHSSLPACLGATYPEFIRYDAIYDPKYEIQPRLMPTKECWPLEDEAATLRNVFREAASVLSSTFVRALDKGAILRQLLELVSCSTVSEKGMKALFMWEQEVTQRTAP